jgi:zinc D-Ala-D-Ala carboxypeptidase
MGWNGWTRSFPICFKVFSRVLRTGSLVLGSALIVSLIACAPRTEAKPEPEAGSQAETPEPQGRDTIDLLEALLTDLPLEVRSAIRANPEGFLLAAAAVLESRSLDRVLVDKSNGLSADFVPEELVSLESFAGPLVVNREGMLLERRAAEALAEMAEAAAEEGITLDVSSAYRSYDYQTGLFDRHVAQLGVEEASRVSARPGHSQHQLGTAVDFGSITLAFGETEAGKWLAREAWRFGFSLSYPAGAEEITGYSYEPWHFRYIGTDGTLLERTFFAGVQQWMLEFLDTQGERLPVARE